MKPVAIFRHTPTEGPGYFATFLDEQGIPWKLVAIDEGDDVPLSPHDYSGLCFMGGPMSVNDDLPWIPPVLELIRSAVASDIPVLGHCLGGQLMSKALGGTISRAPVSEIGWGQVEVADNEIAKRWFGDIRIFDSFHWHGETFTIPHDATHILSSRYCANQAFALGKHLGFQCHVEMTAEMVRVWCEVAGEEIANSRSPAVQQPSFIQHDMAPRLAILNQHARQIYLRWIDGLVK